MNPLTQIRNTQKISKAEVAAGYSDSQSWHARYKHSAYIYAGGLPFALTEGDLLAVFSQYGEIIDVNLVRSKENGKSRGFAFLAYEDQRSTNLAVDNLNGARVGGRIVTVDHVDNYKRKIAEIEGRQASESEDEEAAEAAAARDAAAQAAALAAAVGDGAQVVSESDARIGSNGAAGPSGGGDEPWAAKSSVYSLLNSELPAAPRARPAAEEAEEDPMAAMQRQKRLDKEERKRRKREKKDMKERKEKKRRKGSSSDSDSPPPPPREAAREWERGEERRHDQRREQRRDERETRDLRDRRRSRSPSRREERRRDDGRDRHRR